jgi:glucan phosphoethanolaminetransferase (alkaline phosphatase superfamily)
MSTVIPFLLLKILVCIHGERYSNAALQAAVIATFPVSFFFNHLFYTDSLSVALILCTLLTALYSVQGQSLDLCWTIMSAFVSTDDGGSTSALQLQLPLHAVRLFVIVVATN